MDSTRAHAADYGVIAVQTAYLKVNYPAEYMAALAFGFCKPDGKGCIVCGRLRAAWVCRCLRRISTPQAGTLRSKMQMMARQDPLWVGCGKELVAGAVEVMAGTDMPRQVHRPERLRPPRGFACRRQTLTRMSDQGRGAGCFGNRAALAGFAGSYCGFSNNHFRAADGGQMSLVRRGDGRE